MVDRLSPLRLPSVEIVVNGSNMRLRVNETVVERGFIALLAVLCAVLTVLQYHWTGEMSRAAAERLRADLDNQLPRLARNFDAELSESCRLLVPDNEELNVRTREAVHLERFRRWASTNPRPAFRRLAVAVPENDGLQLYEIDLKSGRMSPAPWPQDWAALQSNLARKFTPQGSPPFGNPTGRLMEFPILGAPPDDAGGEAEWMILELDLDYARDHWLPELVRTYLGYGAQPSCGVEATTLTRTAETLYSNGAPRSDAAKAVSQRFNFQGRQPDDQHGMGGGYRWQLTAWQIPGALEAVVARTRWRNLALAGVLTALVLAAGVALAHYTRRSRKLAQAQMNFVAGVSHELRTPLTVIRGAGHNLLRGIAREPAQIESYSRLILQHADQLTQMVEQILELAGAARQKRSAAPPRPVAVAEVLREAIASAAVETRGAECEVQAEIGPGLPPVSGDAAALRRAFLNLIVNAAKHGGHGGWIGVTASFVNGQVPAAVEVRIEDLGAGVPEDEREEIFKPFFRGAKAQAQQIRGSGLGLSLVREIVESHGGQVSACGRQPRGAVFTVRLPAAKNPGPAK